MATALDIIKSALRLIRVQDADETPSASDAAAALFALNSLLKQWAAQPANIFQSAEISITMTPGDGVYTIADLGSAITQVTQAFIRQNNTDLEMQIWSESEFEAIPNKATGGTPCVLNYDRQTSVRLWPIPTQADTLRIIALVPFTELTLTTSITYPAEYQQALRYALARDVCSEYGSGLWNAELQAKYDEAIGAVKAMNLAQSLAPAQFNMPNAGRSDIWFVKRNFPS